MMAAALSRRGSGLCRELCRVLWRPRTAPFCSKPPDKKPPPRTTAIKKTKPQPEVDVNKLLEELFPQATPGKAPLLARLTIPPAASSVNVSVSNVPPSSKTEPAASESAASDPSTVSSSKQVDVSGDRAAQIDSGPVRVSHTAKEKPLIETTIEPPVKASPVREGRTEPAKETELGGNISHTAVIQKGEASAPIILINKPRVESVDGAVEDEDDRSEEMTLESVTLHVHWVLAASFQTDKLLQTISALEEKADEQARELSVQTEIRAESSNEDEPEILTEVLSKWDSLSEDLRTFEKESGTLTEGLLCQAPPAKTPRSVRTSPAAEAEGETVEYKTRVTRVERLEVEDPRESRSALEEADAPAKETKVDVATLAEVEPFFGTLKEESMSETTHLLEEAAEIVAGDRRAEDEAKAAIAVGSVVADAAPEVTDDLKEVLLEEEPQAEPSWEEDGLDTHADLDPVQRLFLEKIREYNKMRRLKGGLMEAEPGHEKYLSEETAKLRRLYGGGDLSSFPQFTFTEPRLDQDSQ